MSEVEYLTCEKCGRSRPATKDFFKMKTGNRYPMCKTCLTEHIDNNDPTTFKWILEVFNVPFIEEVWYELGNKILAKKGIGKFGSGSVIGQYIRSMNMNQYKNYTYKDTDMLNYEIQKKHAEEEARKKARMEDEAREKELLTKFESGEISEAEYKTLSVKDEKKKTKNKEEEKEDKRKQIGLSAVGNFVIDEEKILKQLTSEDQIYLATKWGIMYTPSEWVSMERIYDQYANEFEMNIDREETLKKICKISLKMDQAIDCGDITGAKNFASILDTLRKSGKFTESQQKEEDVKEFDSIGELVALCEREGGIIEQFPINPDEYPQDKIDLTIKDLKQYNHDLVVNELGLGDLIESYIQKLDEAAKRDQEEYEKMLSTEIRDEEQDAITDQEAEEFMHYLENEIEADAQHILESIGEGDDMDEFS